MRILEFHYPAGGRAAPSPQPLARGPAGRYTALFEDTHMMPFIAQIRRTEVLSRPCRARVA